jgi:hypothetical protein
MSVDIAASTGDGALVQGDSVTAQGLYTVPPHTAVINEAITAAHATLPRLDQIVLEALDDTHAGGGLNKARIRVINGTATAGATLDNRTGAAALPSSCLRLADVLVGAADTSITTAEIRDRRSTFGVTPMARVYHDADQAILTGGTTVAFNSKRYDTDTIHHVSTNNSRLTCRTAGVYRLFFNCSYDPANSGEDVTVHFNLNGSTTIARQRVDPTVNTAEGIPPLVTEYALAVDDYVEVVMASTVNPATLTAAGNYSPEFGMSLISRVS